MFEFDDDEHSDGRQALCERCRKFVSISRIKYLPKGTDTKMALCEKCLKSFNVPGTPKKALSATEAPAMNSYFCSRCNYKFKFSSTKTATLRCPYCGKSDRIRDEKERSADTLVKGAADF